MSPLEDLTSSNLAWISDFVTEQVLIIVRPLIDHLQQANATVDYTQCSVRELSGDISELHCEIDRTNKYLAVMRQGLGVQNESHCSLKVSFESTTKRVKRIEDKIEELVGNILGIKDNVRSVVSDMREVQSKHDDTANHIMVNDFLTKDLQKKVEIVALDTQQFRALKDDLYNNNARLEREFRELRRDFLSIVSKLEEDHRKSKTGNNSIGCSSDCCDVGSTHQSKHNAWIGSGVLQQLDDVSRSCGPGINVEEPSSRTRLPLLTMPGSSRAADVATRSRFS